MKFSQLIEYKMRNIFLEKSYTSCGGKTSLRPFSGKLKWSISGSGYLWIVWSFMQFVFIVLQVESCRNKMKLSYRPLAFTSYWVFVFEEKCFSCYILLIKFHCLVAFTSWDIGQYVYYNCSLTKLWRHEFWN